MLILADTSAWVEYLRGTGSPTHLRLRQAIESEQVVVTDPVMYELMRGARPGDEEVLLRLLGEQEQRSVAPFLDWVDAARVWRHCRSRGAPIRSGLDCLIAAVAIRTGLPVLHLDRDYDAIASCTPLRVVKA